MMNSKNRLGILFLLSMMCAATHAHAKLSYSWIGITGLFLRDGKNTLIFDPVITRPSLFKVMLGTKLQTDEAQVDAVLKTIAVDKADAIFISHSHYDHAFDSPSFAKKTGAKLMGSESTLNIGRGAGLPETAMQKYKAKDQIKIGEFKVTIIEAVHAPIIFNYQMFAGEITKPLAQPASAGDYRMGGSFNFYVEHPEGSFLIHPAANFPDKKDLYSGMSAKVVFQGIASRKSNENIYETLLGPVGAKKVIPLHFDNFFAPIKLNTHDNMAPHVCGFFPIRLESFTEFAEQESLKIEMPTYLQWREVF